MNTDDRIQREIRRRAFERMDILEQQTACAQATRDTIDALEQVTGLPRLDLEKMAGEVSASFAADDDEFFSINDQLIISASMIISMLVITWLMILGIR